MAHVLRHVLIVDRGERPIQTGLCASMCMGPLQADVACFRGLNVAYSRRSRAGMGVVWRARQSVFGQADNTPREHKNQQLLVWSAFLVCTNKFESVTNDFFEVGHTHNVCDQRFSVLAPRLSRSPVLECPEEFADVIRNQVEPTGGRELLVEIIEGAHNWNAYFENMNVSIAGLTTTQKERQVNHSWRIVRRVDVDLYHKASSKDWAVDEVPEAR